MSSAHRFEAKWDETTKKAAIARVRDNGESIKSVAASIGMGYETLRKYVDYDRRINPPSLPDDNPAGDMANRALIIANRELALLEGQASPHNAHDVDLDRLAKVVKLIGDLDKVLKANKPVVKQDAPESPLAALMNGNQANS